MTCFCNETGYQTPKVDTRATVFIDGKILLVHENNGTWSLREVGVMLTSRWLLIRRRKLREESGLTVKSEKIIAVQDWRKHNVTNYAYGVIKIFVQCKYEFGEFEKNIETTEIGFSGKMKYPENLAVEKCTREQLLMCFEAYGNPEMPTIFE